jgi:hypothetical protein
MRPAWRQFRFPAEKPPSQHKPMKSGTVKLIDLNNRIVFEDLYKSSDQWKRIVNSWLDLYGDHIHLYHIQIVPDIPAIKEAPKPLEKPIIIAKVKKTPKNYRYTQLSNREKGNRAFYQ